ncbi:helix-turn-helix transcriptional regulator [Anaerolinea thermolimosa]|uniref:helix-turn-helix transcriptional regulator n=1 Tax=Anaerolinea thermolimosa TaxID=229919 RepID=UPI0013B3BC3C|nr:WYL domain-containing protein [Anaerolinea thermolimosa]
MDVSFPTGFPMRADRLLSLLMLLQTHGRMTARDLAAELEVSERTIYRDLEALSTAGIPVYTERGPGGGIALVEEYRTNLTGLTADEVQALFMLSIPSPLLQLGVGETLRSALRKLAAALPPSRLPDREMARQRIYLDTSWWGQPGQVLPHLATVQQAIWQERRLRVAVRTFFGGEIDVIVEPLGLVAKASEWHLVALRSGRPHVYRVADLTAVEMLEDAFERPADFNLVAFWEAYCARVEAERGIYGVRLRISPDLARELTWHLGEQAAGALSRAGAPDAEGWREITLWFSDPAEARGRILSLGRAAEVIDPLPLRKSVLDYARQIVQFYEERSHEKG